MVSEVVVFDPGFHWLSPGGLRQVLLREFVLGGSTSFIACAQDAHFARPQRMQGVQTRKARASVLCYDLFVF